MPSGQRKKTAESIIDRLRRSAVPVLSLLKSADDKDFTKQNFRIVSKRKPNKETNRNMILWDGSCVVHEAFSFEKIVSLIKVHPKAKFIAHPESESPVLDICSAAIPS